jgi:hypothetical protein
MCEPTTLAIGMTAMTAASAVASVQAQRKASSDTQNQMQNQANMIEKQTSQAFQDLALQRVAVRDQNMQQQHENQQQGKQSLAQAQAAYGEAGIEGQSVDAVMRELMGQVARNADAISADYTNKMVGLDISAQRGLTSAQDQIQGLGTVHGPSLGASLLQVGSAAVQGYGIGRGMVENNAHARASKGH